ncbi:MAG: radical SAM protein [Candidatus Coatesbacteria bacterium]|nr:radical SAM protein [Candidatus Coatesbacteria bacterium]
MIDTKTINLAFKAGRNLFYQNFYMKTGINLLKPTNFYSIINEFCNARCKICDMWTRNKIIDLPAEIWIKHLESIHDWLGRYYISFSGGEPLIKKDFFNILEFCNQKGISCGVVTNSIKIDKQMAEELIKLRVFNISISVDGAKAETHDYLRGVPGLFDHVIEVVSYLKDAKEKNKVPLRIIFKTVVNSRNLEEIPDIIRLVEKLGITGVMFQPVFKWTEATKNELWVKDIETLDKVIREVIKLYKNGSPILVSQDTIQLWRNHFLEEKLEPKRICNIGLNNYLMQWDGKVFLCTFFPSIGNLSETKAKDIWYSEKAENIRKATINCRKTCLNTCTSKKSINDRLKQFFQLLKS